MNTAPQGPDWWLADDGHWYPPERHPNYQSSGQSSTATTTQLSRQQVQQARREGSRYGNGQGSPAAPGAPIQTGEDVRNVGATGPTVDSDGSTPATISMSCPRCGSSYAASTSDSSSCPSCGLTVHAVSCPYCRTQFFGVGQAPYGCPRCQQQVWLGESRASTEVGGAADDYVAESPSYAPQPPPRASTSSDLPPRQQSKVMFRGARIVSVVFKVAAWLVLLGGAVSAVSTYQYLHSEQSSNPTAVAVSIFAGSVLGASAFAFFGYVLDLLRAAVLESRTKGASDADLP